jgi:hypothetical protein
MNELQLVREAVAQARRANELLDLCLEAHEIMQLERHLGTKRKRKVEWLKTFNDFLLKTKQELEDNAE